MTEYQLDYQRGTNLLIKNYTLIKLALSCGIEKIYLILKYDNLESFKTLVLTKEDYNNIFINANIYPNSKIAQYIYANHKIPVKCLLTNYVTNTTIILNMMDWMSLEKMANALDYVPRYANYSKDKDMIKNITHLKWLLI